MSAGLVLDKDHTDADDTPMQHVQRVELVLARPDHKPLNALGLTPDPLQQLAMALASVRHDAGESADVVFDLVPISDRRLQRRRRSRMAAARREGPSAYGEKLTGPGFGGSLTGSFSAAWSGGKSVNRPQQQRLPRAADLSVAVGKFAAPGAVFAVQILLRTAAAHPQRARALMNQLLAVFGPTAGENALRPRRPRGTHAIARFEHRLATGEFAPVKRQWLTVPELAGFLKPPTARCSAPGVVRSGGLVPPAPRDLPEYTGQRHLVPLGAVTYADGQERIGAIPVRDFLFALLLGKSGHGKTEEALVQAIAVAHCGYGTWFMDPHGEAWARAKPYLAHPHIQSRVWEINLALSEPDQLVASWNPLSMEQRTESHIDDAVRTITEGIAAAQDWGDRAPRARTILARTAQALALLNLQAVKSGQPEAQCTIFQIRTWLTDDEWREQLLPRLPKTVRAYWENTFPKMASDAVPTVTYAIDRLDTSRSLRAFFGSARSAYNVRTAMDTQRIVFLCPSGSEADAIVSCLLIHDLYRTGLTRQDTPREERSTLFAWGDELTALDSSSKGFLAAIAEQLRKYEIRFTGATQMALRLSAETRQALLQNQSLLSTCAADYDEAAFVAKRWNGYIRPETITELPKYSYIMSIALHGKRTKPFRVRGLSVEELYAHYNNPDGLPDLDAAIDTNLRRRPVAEILADLEALDALVLDHHTGHRPAPSARPAVGAAVHAGVDPTTPMD